MASAIVHIYPSLVPFTDFKVMEQNGVQIITEWNNSNPQPTQDQIDSAWFEIYKKYKKDYLDGQCDLATMGGFTSNALGTVHTYPSDFQAMVYFTATLNRFTNDPAFTSANQKTIDSGYLPHTKAQFVQVFNDGHQYGEDQITKLNKLKADVDVATTTGQVDEIKW